MKKPPQGAAWIRGGRGECEPDTAPKRVYHLVLLGAPGAGKGTQAALLAERLGPCHWSTGELFRAAPALDPCDHTPALAAALEHMRRGELVPDATVLGLVRERRGCLRCRGGFLLDGFPRTLAQAEALDRILAAEHVKLDAVLARGGLCAEPPRSRLISSRPARQQSETRSPTAPSDADGVGSGGALGSRP